MNIDSKSVETSGDVQYFMIRTLPELVEKGLVGVGWVDCQFKEKGSAQEAIDEIDSMYGVGRRGNQIRRFFDIKDGDIIVVPLPYEVAIGRAVGGMLYDPSYYDLDRGNQRRVEFLRDRNGAVFKVRRAFLSEGFQRRLRVQGMTVNSLEEFAPEIGACISMAQIGPEHIWEDQVAAIVEQKQAKFAAKLIENIQVGKTHLKAGGLGLEQLVLELLELDGYTATMLSKRHFSSFADADIMASRSDRWATTNLLVQVKHHQGFTDSYGLRQLAEIREVHKGEYDDHQHVLVTSAQVTAELLAEAQKASVIVIAAEELVAWIAEHLRELKSETKLALGIFEVPAVMD